MPLGVGSIRARLMVLVLLAVLPALGIILLAAAQQRGHALTMAKEQALELAQDISRLQNDHLSRAEDMAFALAQTSQVQGLQAGACAELFAAVLRKTPQLINLSAWDPDGRVLASGHPLSQSVNLGDRAWFQQTVREGQPAVSGYVVGRITNKPVIAVTQPVLDEQGGVRAVLVASTDLEWFNRSLDDLGMLPSGAYVTIIDSEGVVLMRHPRLDGLLGRKLPNAQVAQAVLGQRRGVVQAQGIDGAQRVYGFAPLHPGRHFAYAIVGVPEVEAFAESQHNLGRYLLLLALAAVLALVAAWLVGSYLLVRPVNSLLGVTRRLAQGDLSVRSGLPRGGDELSQLAVEFDGMADSLAWQYTELQQSLASLSRSNRALRMLGDSNQAMVRAGDEIQLMEQACRILVEQGGYRLAWVGLAMRDQARSVRPVAQWGDGDGYVQSLDITWADGQRGRGPTGQAIRTGQPVAADHIAADPDLAPWRAAALQRGLASSLALPLVLEGQTLGALNVYAPRPEAFPPEEVELLSELADNLAFGIRWLRARADLEGATEELRRHRDSLEELVVERTAELDRANEQLKREMAEHLRAEQEALNLAAIVESSHDAIVGCDPQGIITSFNRGAEEIYGHPAPEALGRHFSILLTPGDQDAMDDILARTNAGQTVDHYEALHRKKDGSLINVSLNISPIRDPQGRIMGASSIARDLGEHKLAEMRQRASEEKFTKAFQAVPVWLVLGEFDTGRYLEVNDAFVLGTGFSRPEVVGRTSLEIGIWAEPADREEFVRVIKRDGRLRDFSARFRTKDGKVRHCLVSCELLSLGERPTLLSVVYDVTERQLAEQKLHDEMSFSQSLLKALPGVFCLTNRQGRVLRWNQNLEKVTGFGKDQMPGLNALDFFAPQERAGVAQAIEEVFAQGQAFLEARLGTKDGGRPYYLTGLAVDLAGAPGLLGVGLDISQRKEAEARLEKTLAELARSNAELEQFAYVASHDLQEPLRIVTNYLQLLERRHKDKLEPEAAKFILQAVNGAARMRGLIQDLLAYSRVGTRGRSLEPVSAETVMEDVLANLKMSIESCGAVVTSDPLPTVKADPGQLSQLLQNLIGNALKFRGPDPPRVHVSARKQDGQWAFAVRDNGIGIEPQYLERIFGVFQRLHTRSEYPGTGIGLAICKRIVERHQGRMWVESRPGRGSTFHFSIPAGERE